MKFRDNYFKVLFISCKSFFFLNIVGMHEVWFFVAKDQIYTGNILMFAVFNASLCVMVTVFLCFSIWLNEITD